MGIPNEEIKEITEQYIDETEENLEIELAPFYTEGWAINDKETAMKVDYIIHKLEEKIQEDEQIAENQKTILQAKIEKLQEGLSKLDEWLERSTKPYKTRIEDLKTHLLIYHKRVVATEEVENDKRIAEGKKPLKVSKSIKLTYHDLTSRSQVPETKKDEEQLTKWVIDNYSSFIPLERIQELTTYTATTVQDLMALILEFDSPYVKRETKLLWSDYKSTLTIQKIDGKLQFVDENGETVPFIELIERDTIYDFKTVKS